MRLRIPLPPSVNRIFKIVKVGGRYRLGLTGEARRWKRSVSIAIAANRKFIPLDVGNGSYAVMRIWYRFPDRRRRDTHNHLKLLCDAVAEGLGIDDRWILVQEVGVEIDPRSPGIEIEIAEAGDEIQTVRGQAQA